MNIPNLIYEDETNNTFIEIATLLKRKIPPTFPKDNVPLPTLKPSEPVTRNTSPENNAPVPRVEIDPKDSASESRVDTAPPTITNKIHTTSIPNTTPTKAQDVTRYNDILTKRIMAEFRSRNDTIKNR